MGCSNSNVVEEKKNDINSNTKRSDNENNKENDLNIYSSNNRNSKNKSKIYSNREQKEKNEQDIYYKNELTKDVKKEKDKEINIKKELNKNDNKENYKKEKEIYVTKEKKQEKEKIKKTITKKLKFYSFLSVSEELLDFLTDNISKNELHQLIYDALRNSIINEKDRYIKGKNLTVEQVNCLIDILYNCMANIDNDKDEKKGKELLGDIKLKLDFCDINKENVRKIIFKDVDPSDEDLEEMLAQFNNSNDKLKLFVIELS